MKKNSCKHNGFWNLYRVINFRSQFCKEQGQHFYCEQCGTECSLKWKGCKQLKIFSLKSGLIYLLRMVPAILFIALFVHGLLYPWEVILLTVIYHFIAMIYIIKFSDRLKVKEA